MPVIPFRISRQRLPECLPAHIPGIEDLYFACNAIRNTVVVQVSHLTTGLRHPVKASAAVFRTDIEIEFLWHEKKLLFSNDQWSVILLKIIEYVTHSQ